MTRVMVVDDAACTRLRLHRLLSENGYEVHEAANGKEAVEKYQELKPDVVLMDIAMPEMDGLEATKAILLADCHAKIVMCSAFSQQCIILEAIRSGAKDFVIKPYDPSRILQAIARCEEG